jgi:hypothetical protein
MAWKNKNDPSIVNDPTYLEPRVSAVETKANNNATSLTEKVKKNDLFINVKDFGAKGDGVTDDTVAIQAAIDAVNGTSSLVGQTGLKAINALYFPPGDYIVNGTINISDTVSGGLAVYGAGSLRDTRMGTRIISNVVGAVFLSRKYNATFSNISFYHAGTAKAIGTTAIQMQKLVNSDDAELEVIGCVIDNYETGVKHEGRSCKVTGGSIANCKYGVSLSWTSNGVYDVQPNHTDLPFGFRAFHIADMRFHFCDYAVYNSGTLNNDQIRSVLIANNLLDFHTKLFYGGLNYAVIEGNMIDLENDDDAIAKIHIVSGGKNISIVGNTLTGYMSTGANVPARKGKLGIRFDVLAQGCTIVGNSLSGFADAAIDVSAGATGSTIAANTLFDNNIALRLNGTFTSSIVSNNAYSGNSTMNGGLPTFSSDSRFDVRGTFVNLMTTANALNNCLFQDTGDSNKLKFKDGTGTVKTITVT